MAISEERAAELAALDPHIKLQATMDSRRARIEMVRLAKEVLTENARNSATDDLSISASDIIDFADELLTFVNS